MRGTAVCRHTDSQCAPLQGTKPRDLCLKHRTVRSFSLPVLALVESFPGAMSPLGSKEPNELFLSPHTVFVSSTPQQSLHSACGLPPQWRLGMQSHAVVCDKPCGTIP